MTGSRRGAGFSGPAHEDPALFRSPFPRPASGKTDAVSHLRIRHALLVAFLAAGICATWLILDLPPPGVLWSYGLNPACAPTGNSREVEGVEFVEVGPGVFRMGTEPGPEEGDFLGRLCRRLGLPWGDQRVNSDEVPSRWVEFPDGFWIARTEVTNQQYERFDPNHRRARGSDGDDDPVGFMTWDEAVRYCEWLGARSGIPIRLPSEAEWECACRAGSRGKFCFGDSAVDLPEYAWFQVNAPDRAREVATRRPNAWGLFDMHGNVAEWCLDTYHEDYAGAPSNGTAWTEGGLSTGKNGVLRRIVRGGSFGFSAGECRSAYRLGWRGDGLCRTIGIRPAFTLK